MISRLIKLIVSVSLVFAAYSVWSLTSRSHRTEPLRSRSAAAGNLDNAPAGERAMADPYADFRGAKYANDNSISEQDEIRLGKQLHLQVLKQFKLTSVGQARVNQIGQRVAKASLRPSLAYKFYVIDGREINAFSGPGGYVYVTTALLKMTDNDELAAVLSHEIGHVVARHSLKSIEQSAQMNSLADWFGSVAAVAGKTAERLGKAAASIVGHGLLAVHTREEEREADYLGIHTSAMAGFAPSAMISMFEKLQRAAKDNESILGSIFDDHPDLKERIDNTRYEIARMRG
jgi:predicted Zn-dependent protease